MEGEKGFVWRDEKKIMGPKGESAAVSSRNFLSYKLEELLSIQK
jgi:hypothetical protein